MGPVAQGTPSGSLRGAALLPRECISPAVDHAREGPNIREGPNVEPVEVERAIEEPTVDRAIEVPNASAEPADEPAVKEQAIVVPAAAELASDEPSVDERAHAETDAITAAARTSARADPMRACPKGNVVSDDRSFFVPAAEAAA